MDQETFYKRSLKLQVDVGKKLDRVLNELKKQSTIQKTILKTKKRRNNNNKRYKHKKRKHL